VTTEFENRVGFAIGSGRCGTLFLYQLLDKEPMVASSHERNPDNESFHRYCKWHELPVDHEGFLSTKQKEIESDLANCGFSFEASPYLSLSVRELHERFGARFVLLMRRPDRVVTSFVHKGFYRRPYVVADPSLATGYQDLSPERVHAFFARIAPRGEFLRTWNDMTQVGRVAWFWRAWNERTLTALSELPPESYWVVRIEDFDYANYQEVSRFLGFEAKVSQADFEALRESKPHSFRRKRNVDQWSEQEIREFEEQVGDLAERFGYEYRVAHLFDEAQAEADAVRAAGHLPEKQPQRLWRLRVSMARWLRDIAGAIDVQ
jgi:hypothetical protein